MARKNRQLDEKFRRAERERMAFGMVERCKDEMRARPLTAQEGMICLLASVGAKEVFGRNVRVVKAGVTGKNVAKRQPDALQPAIIAAHW